VADRYNRVIPIQDAVAITDGGTEIADRAQGPARALWCGTSGDITLTLIDGGTITLKSVAAGVWHPVVFTSAASFVTIADVVAGF
jgi:hypothetical protein